MLESLRDALDAVAAEAAQDTPAKGLVRRDALRPPAKAGGPRSVIVLIEDDESLRRLLRTTLKAHGFDIQEAGTGRSGLVLAANRKPDLILLDLELPDLNGGEIINRVRSWWASRPIIVLSGHDAEETKVKALEQGADDYITKPFAVPELLARIRAALRHSSQILEPEGNLDFFSLGVRVDLLRREVTRDGEIVRLTPIEYRVLATLVKHAGQWVTRDRLLAEVWGPDHVEQMHYLRTYIASLRRKLDPTPANPRLLLTDIGIGYRIVKGSTTAELE